MAQNFTYCIRRMCGSFNIRDEDCELLLSLGREQMSNIAANSTEFETGRGAPLAPAVSAGACLQRAFVACHGRHRVLTFCGGASGGLWRCVSRQTAATAHFPSWRCSHCATTTSSL
jgi:hypothetical protein